MNFVVLSKRCHIGVGHGFDWPAFDFPCSKVSVGLRREPAQIPGSDCLEWVNRIQVSVTLQNKSSNTFEEKVKKRLGDYFMEMLCMLLKMERKFK